MYRDYFPGQLDNVDVAQKTRDDGTVEVTFKRRIGPKVAPRPTRRLRCASGPGRTGALLRLFGRLQQIGEQRTQLRVLVRRARRFTPTAADKVATLARSNPDPALEAFVSAFQREHFELDEAICEQ